MIEGYRSFELIGHGGFSTVYRAEQEIFDRRAAVKVMHSDLRDPAAERRFVRACKATGRPTGHPRQHGYSQAWEYLPATVVTLDGQNEPIPGVPACSGYL
ncbi:hypothetical protein ThrDRAFT_04307 [Frankia casuarinae]|nr:MULTISPECIES: hypothetical protein [Frankia]ETA02049.1 hypothetical protein CcI6DRAFT_02573 [Frankia sp. CcI6]KDA42207.1 hypothetical protein BMG523Draft_02943 [Frankia sp. BMG5.23]KFB04255.1 hypothetical protein ALLO2DRAFT_03027 [Frankia sp. Allo2]EYT90077.1 hypothetical protein ThrDRAFT_04307 [Frankia casuarinae]OAA23421.1 hypothetical protein AAY23_105411 [Frankia casuarinae]